MGEKLRFLMAFNGFFAAKPMAFSVFLGFLLLLNGF